MKNIPWVEKYRPKNLNDIVLSTLNKKILNNIIKDNYFPNLLFYGPPGTGKTTTIINLIKEYQECNSKKDNELIIHLNASDDRGIDVIRNQIQQFVNSKAIFGKGLKFVILDEVDYMTKNAQQALRFLIQENMDNVRYCLICNYISRIDVSLQNEFIRLRFNELPKREINKFLNEIVKSENVKVSSKKIGLIQNKFSADIRSMINYIQSNQEILSCIELYDDTDIELIINNIVDKVTINELMETFKSISNKYNIEQSEILISIFNYLIKNNKIFPKDYEVFFTFVKFVLHNININPRYTLKFSLLKLQTIQL
uniref:AAA+ ATPase domain-containing protein n=1 Tax=viral metagenome TaxID=1070528 RepID=A0A6C0KJ71_9ZZZZ